LIRRLQRKYILAFHCTQKLALEKILGLHYSHFEIVTPCNDETFSHSTLKKIPISIPVEKNGLAKKVGCSQQAVSAVEQAGYKRHSLPLLRRIAHVLDADVVVALVPRKAA
jgi:transcriptional regulator with XRE-family HTH domain